MSDGDAVLRAIRTRRSVGKVSQEPLPREPVEELIEAAGSAPNHRLTAPWRFIVLTGDIGTGKTTSRGISRTLP